MNSDAYLRLPDQWVNHWRLEMDETSIIMRFCPWCGQNLQIDQSPERGVALEHVESIGIRPPA